MAKSKFVIFKRADIEGKDFEEILPVFLNAFGFYGLFNQELGCACSIKDLSCHDCFSERCCPGYKAERSKGRSCDDCPQGWDFCINSTGKCEADENMPGYEMEEEEE